MGKQLLLAFLICLISPFTGVARLNTGAVDISGTWAFSVELENGDRGFPTFVLTQKGESLTGTYKGPLGEQNVSGTVKGKKAIFSFDFSRGGQTFKSTYIGTIETAIKMTGTVESSIGVRGKWTAIKKNRYRSSHK